MRPCLRASIVPTMTLRSVVSQGTTTAIHLHLQ